MIKVDINLSKNDFLLNAKFETGAEGVTGIYGPSGSGKTSLLRAIAGLEPGTRGSISVSGTDFQSGGVKLAVHQRQIAMVFQDANLFTHLSVEENLLYGRDRLEKAPKISDLDSFYQLLGVQELLSRKIDGLSGGEQQRIALGRALLAEPRLLLMDEPLSALDQDTRQQLMLFLENLFQQFEIPVLYVSHSSQEIARLADRLVVMEQGEVKAFGEIQRVLSQVDSSLASSDSSFSVIKGRIEQSDADEITLVRSEGGELFVLPGESASSLTASKVRLRIRARDVSLCLDRPENSSILNILPATIAEISSDCRNGSRIIKLDLGSDTVLAKVSDYSVRQLALTEGMELYAQIKSAALLN